MNPPLYLTLPLQGDRTRRMQLLISSATPEMQQPYRSSAR